MSALQLPTLTQWRLILVESVPVGWARSWTHPGTAAQPPSACTAYLLPLVLYGLWYARVYALPDGTAVNDQRVDLQGAYLGGMRPNSLQRHKRKCTAYLQNTMPTGALLWDWIQPAQSIAPQQHREWDRGDVWARLVMHHTPIGVVLEGRAYRGLEPIPRENRLTICADPTAADVESIRWLGSICIR